MRLTRSIPAPILAHRVFAAVALSCVALLSSSINGAERHRDRASTQTQERGKADCSDIGACFARFVVGLRRSSGIEKRHLEAATGLRLAASGDGIYGYSVVSAGRVLYRVETGPQTHSAMLDVFQVETGKARDRCLVDFQEFARKLRRAGYAQQDVPTGPLSGGHVDFKRGEINVYALTRILSPRSDRVCVRRITIESGES